MTRTGAAVMVGAVVRRQFHERRRYVTDLVGLLVSTYVVFLLILLGARQVAGAGSFAGDDAAGLVVGFVVVTLATLVYATTSGGVQEEAARGTLEQVAMTPYGLPAVLLATTAAAAVFQVVEVALLLALASLTTGVSLELDPASLLRALPALAALLLGVQGLGLAVGGVVLVAKRATALAQLLPLSFVVLVVAPVEETPALAALPVALPGALLREALVAGGGYSAPRVLLALGVGAAWCTAGLLAFAWCERLARDRALLGTY